MEPRGDQRILYHIGKRIQSSVTVHIHILGWSITATLPLHIYVNGLTFL